MYFTDEEKEMIRKIAKKKRYGISDFLNDNDLVEEKVNLTRAYERFVYFNASWVNRTDFGDNNIITTSYILNKCKENYIQKLDDFIRIAIVLEKINMVNVVEVDVFKTKENFTHFVKTDLEGNHEIDTINCRNFAYYIDKELISHQEFLNRFIRDDFKTKDEIHMEKALKSADKSFKVSLWIAGISIFLSILSIYVSVLAIVKESEVRVKNLNDIKIEKLEKQLETSNKELGDIKGLLNQKKKM